MLKVMRAVLAGAALLGIAACESLITGGPLIREGEPTGIIEIANGSSNVVTSVLISSCDASTYGLNRLPEGVTIAPRTYYRFTVSAGCWDVMAGYGTTTGYSAATERMQVQANGGVRYTVTD